MKQAYLHSHRLRLRTVNKIYMLTKWHKSISVYQYAVVNVMHLVEDIINEVIILGSSP